MKRHSKPEFYTANSELKLFNLGNFQSAQYFQPAEIAAHNLRSQQNFKIYILVLLIFAIFVTLITFAC